MSKDAERSPIILPSLSEITDDMKQNPVPHGAQPRKGRGRAGIFVTLGLVLLAVIVVLTGLFIHFGSISTFSPAQKTTVSPEQTGTFITAPYNTSQLNALTHLVDRMNYKELASLYVAHMPLDEKLGQMIITESEQNTYSDDLNYMITQLHVGGMIMYESHLQTASQARATTSQAQQNAKI